LATTVSVQQNRLVPKLARDSIESAMVLMHVRCPAHNEWPVIMARSGQITFYCGCTRSNNGRVDEEDREGLIL